MIKKIRRVVVLAAVLCVGSLGIAAVPASAHPPNTLMHSTGAVVNGRLVIDFTCHAYALDAVAINILYCITRSSNGEIHYAASKAMSGPYASTGAIATLPVLPYSVCMRAQSTHSSGLVSDTFERCQSATHVFGVYFS
jgi:hypothetical protein